MVVIEPHETEEPQSSSKPTAFSTSDAAEAPPSNVNGDASDGFETASERDVSDDDDAAEVDREVKEERKEEHEGEAGGEGEQKQPQQKAGDSYEDALNDEELKQKALAQANEEKLEGNKLFGSGKHEEALLQYEAALQTAPDMPASVELRSICHSNRAVCFLKMGKYEDTIKECKKALELNPSYVKALVRRGEAHEKLEHYEEAISDMKKILELDPSNVQARKTIQRLEPLAAEKREKMKEEMIAKLKDVGNSVLGRFGMSVDNFKAVKDPNTGSYSISFQR